MDQTQWIIPYNPCIDQWAVLANMSLGSSGGNLLSSVFRLVGPHPPLKYILDFFLASSKSPFTLSAPPAGLPATTASSDLNPLTGLYFLHCFPLTLSTYTQWLKQSESILLCFYLLLGFHCAACLVCCCILWVWVPTGVCILRSCDTLNTCGPY